MRVMSYNIHSGRNMDNVFDIDALSGVLLELKPDICALNEVRMGTTDVHGLELARVLGDAAGMEWRFGRAIDVSGGEYGNAILSRYPILSQRVIAVPDIPVEERRAYFEPRAALECVVRTPDGPVRVITCHFGLSDGERREAVKVIQSMVTDDMPCLFMGDLNAEPHDPVLKPLNDLLVDTAGDEPLTFSARDTRIKIDYIYTSGQFTCGPLRTYATLASDHLPVYVDMERKPSQGQ